MVTRAVAVTCLSCCVTFCLLGAVLLFVCWVQCFVVSLFVCWMQCVFYLFLFAGYSVLLCHCLLGAVLSCHFLFAGGSVLCHVLFVGCSILSCHLLFVGCGILSCHFLFVGYSVTPVLRPVLAL